MSFNSEVRFFGDVIKGKCVKMSGTIIKIIIYYCIVLLNILKNTIKMPFIELSIFFFKLDNTYIADKKIHNE